MSIEAMKRIKSLLQDTKMIDSHTISAVVAECDAVILTQQLATSESVQADSSEHLRVIASLGAALRQLSFAAQTTGGTNGPDVELQSAIGQAEQALSLGGIWQAMSATTEPVKVAPYNPTEEMRWAMKRIDPALSSEQCRALWSAAWSAAPFSTTPQPAQATQVEAKTDKPAAVRNPFAARCYTMSESHLSGHRLIVGFEKLGDAQDAHEWVARQGRGDFTHPVPSAPNDHQIAALVNKVRDIARMFHDHQSLRERIAIELVPAIKASQEVKSNAERWRYAIADGGNQSMNFIDIFDDWDGDGSFVEAFDKARLADKEGGAA